MPRGLKGERRPHDLIGDAVHVMWIGYRAGQGDPGAARNVVGIGAA
jgi:hypothetical protein